MIRLIAAIDRSRGLAKKGILPWNIPEDKQYYVDKTKEFGGQVLVGKSTFYQSSSDMKERTMFVLTSHTEPIEGAEVVNGLEQFWNQLEGDLWVIGGASVFEQAIGRADELYLTEIDADFGCDQFFPEFMDNFWLEHQTGTKEQNGFFYRFSVYKPTTRES